MSINQLYHITRRSFQTLDAAMNVVGQNVANANTEGYHRRRIGLQPIDFVGRGIWSRSVGQQPYGYGVDIGTYQRLQDALAAHAAREARTSLGYAEEQHRILSTLEGIFPVDTGSLQDRLNDFWNAWSDLADNPLGTAERLTLRSRAESLTGLFGQLDADIARLEDDTKSALAAGVDDLNSLLEKIAELNRRIAQANNQGTPDFSAEDERDALVRELADFVPVQVNASAPDGYLVTINGMAVVQGEHAMPLTLDLDASPPVLSFSDTGVAFTPTSEGRLGAWLDALTTDLPGARAALDELAATLVSEVNALHATGFGLDGANGRPFFDPAGLTASTFRLSDNVLADANVIAASGDATAEGDNSVALAIADLRNAPLLNGGRDTAETFAINLVSDLGGKIAAAASRAEGQSGALTYLEGLEKGTSGVSVDEEMTRLIELQQAYAATARVLETAQRMMDTLLAI